MKGSAVVSQPFRVPGHERRPWGVALGVLLIAFGVVETLGYALNIRALSLHVNGWPAPTLLDCIELSLVGLAFVSHLATKQRAALAGSSTAASALAVFGGLVAMFGALGAYRMPFGGSALSTAVLFSTLAFAILFANASRSPRTEERALGTAGFIVVALVGTMLSATAMGVLDPVLDRNVAGSSLQTLLAALVVGVYWLGVLWSSGRVTVESADWLPAGFGFATILTVLVLWRALAVRETLQLRALTEQAGEAQSIAIAASAQTLARPLLRAAERRADGADLHQQARDLQTLPRDLRGLESAVYETWPASDQRESVGGDASRHGEIDAIWRNRMRGVNALRDSALFWPIDSVSQHFAIVAPSCANESCGGAIVGVVDSDKRFANILSDTTLGFYHALSSSASRTDSIRGRVRLDSAALVGRDVKFGDVQLHVLTWPTVSTIARVRSKLPAIVLVLGVLVGVLLFVTTSLGQSARRVATSREKARLASVLERSTDGVWEWELISNQADHSAGIWRNLGYMSGGDRQTRDAWETLIHGDDFDGFNRSIQRHLKGDSEAFEHEYRVRSHSGEWHTMVDRARVVERTPSGEPLRLLGVRADVTEARNAHAARLLNERRFRAIFDSGFQYQLLLDVDGQVLEVNRVALEACDSTVDDVVGKPVVNTLWWKATPEARQPLREAIAAARQGAAARYESDVHCDDGPTTTLEVALKPFLDLAGETNQLLLEARDITVRRRAEAALQEVDTLTTMGRVAARVAHEINNPLAGIQNSFLLIKGAIPTTHPHYAYVGAIEREIDRIAAVTRQLYETYRPEQDPGGGTSVRSLVSDAVSFLAQVNRGTHVRIETEFSNLPSVIQLPSAMLRQIVYNLAQNAIEASPSGQTVTIQSSLNGNTFRLAVRDGGTGVPLELRDRIFDPFFSTKDRGVRTGGMGLGLALVRRTVTAAGGNIEVTDAPDGGSIFTVTLPVTGGAQGEDAR